MQKCISALTEEDDLNERDADSEAKNIEQKITHFTDLARWIFRPKRLLHFIQESGNLLLEQEVPDLQPQARVHFERGDRRPSTHAAKISSLCFRTPWS